MADKGYTQKVMSFVGNMPTNAIVTVAEVRDALPPEATRATAASILSVLSQGDDPILRRERSGVYRVIRGGRRAPGRPPRSVTQVSAGSVAANTAAIAKAARRVTEAVAPQQDPGAPMLLLEHIRDLGDGSAVYNDETGYVYKVVRIA